MLTTKLFYWAHRDFDTVLVVWSITDKISQHKDIWPNEQLEIVENIYTESGWFFNAKELKDHA